jgi:hypothetical protein
LNDTESLETFRAQYRSLWDAHQVLADQNARLLKAGRALSAEQLIKQKLAADALERARIILVAEMARR